MQFVRILLVAYLDFFLTETTALCDLITADQCDCEHPQRLQLPPVSAWVMPRTTQKKRDEWLLAFQALAMEWGGQCLSNEYINQSTKLLFRCTDGHEWFATPTNVYHRSSWCPHCSGNAKLDINSAHEAARAVGGVCLSTEYVSVHEPLKWRCANKHEFTAALNSVRNNGGFCMQCQKLTLAEFQRLADSIGYTLLSEEYVYNYTKIRVLCDVGHLWYVRPKHFKEGRRCPDC